MAEVIVGENAVDAWKKASHAILAAPSYKIRNLVVEFENATKLEKEWFQKFDPKSVGSTDRLSVVMKVLFPHSAKKAGETRQQFYDRWNATLTRSKKAKKLAAPWGTYFTRLTAFADEKNQLESIIHALSTWKMRPEAALVAHTSAPTLDTIKPIGSPCLQYVEVLWRRDDVIDLTAVYRNHDFLKKALGNYLGLGQLLKFIAAESNKTPGRVSCHSIRAYCEEPTRLKSLIAK